MSKGTHSRKIYLEDLPKYSDGEFKGCINWVGLDNVKVRFEYDGVLDTFTIIKFDKEKEKCLIDYNGFQTWCYRSTIKRFEITNIIGKRNSDFKYKIGDRYIHGDTDITIIDRVRNGNKKMYKYRCNKCGYDLSKPIYLKGKYKDLWVAETNLKAGVGCLGCGNSNNVYVQEGINSIVDTDPWMIKYFLGGYDEAKRYSSGSTVKVQTRCPQCNQIKHKKLAIYSIKNVNYSCPYCSDGISYPQKFVASVLRQCFEPFVTEYSPSWANGRKYDFYLPEENIIIEVDGGIGHGKETYDNKPDVIGAKVDKEKDDLAIENASILVIRIQADKSEFEYMKNSVIENLGDIFDLDLFVDWVVVEKDALNSLVIKACELYNKGFSVSNIAQDIHLSTHTIYAYLKRGIKIRLIK